MTARTNSIRDSANEFDRGRANEFDPRLRERIDLWPRERINPRLGEEIRSA
jgi:hypothetical protein